MLPLLGGGAGGSSVEIDFRLGRVHKRDRFAGSQAREEDTGRKEVATIGQTTLGLPAIPKPPPPGATRPELSLVRPKPERCCLIVGADDGTAMQRLDADVPPLPRGKGVKASIGNERRHLQVDGARAPHKAVGHEGRVDTVRHPDPALDRCVSDGERPYRQRSLLTRAGAQEADPVVQQLVLAADQFLVARPLPDDPGGRSVIAGYHWFNDWGRDTMISLPGLTLTTGRNEEAASILRTFARYLADGLLPNNFPDSAGVIPGYNTADATLWYVLAVRAYEEATGDDSLVTDLLPALLEIVERHLEGTRYGIGADPADGLLRAGEPGVQLTWMDAKVGDWVVTPRIGKPVEINALWYNALRIMSAFAGVLALPDNFSASAEAAERSFARFVRADGEGLYDVIDGPKGYDRSIRPNQIFAVSLPHSPLTSDDQTRVVQVCRRHLLTAFGLRSLAPGSPDYHPGYGGGVSERDGGYHQGPVWAWLLGPFCVAAYRVTGDAAAAEALLVKLSDALEDQGVGTIGEIFEGDPPHRPRGAPAQAWSVACTLEAWWLLRQEEQPKHTSIEMDGNVPPGNGP